MKALTRDRDGRNPPYLTRFQERTVACPRCGAVAGESCHNVQGDRAGVQMLTTRHKARKALAWEVMKWKVMK